MTDIFTLKRGDAPLIISIPHLGTHIPDALRGDYTDIALSIADTDWHLDRLYAFAKAWGATVLGARVALCDRSEPAAERRKPVSRADHHVALPARKVSRRAALSRWVRARCGRSRTARTPVLAAVSRDAATEVRRLRSLHANVLLWEAHSIASVLPRLFDDKLPDLNIGTQDGRTADASVQTRVAHAA
ncbi:N-formylglutamate deformylase [Candidatus Paraburkholderia calva]|nr:N-formylglutamate deformylase [Candidatus Paraburkholderia calva]